MMKHKNLFKPVKLNEKEQRKKQKKTSKFNKQEIELNI